MTGDACIVCGNTRKKEPKLSFHRFPKDDEKRAKWLKVFGLSESQFKFHSRVCSRHFVIFVMCTMVAGRDPREGISISTVVW